MTQCSETETGSHFTAEFPEHIHQCSDHSRATRECSHGRFTYPPTHPPSLRKTYINLISSSISSPPNHAHTSPQSITMFTKPTVTSTAVVAGRLRLRFRGLFRASFLRLTTFSFRILTRKYNQQKKFTQSRTYLRRRTKSPSSPALFNAPSYNLRTRLLRNQAPRHWVSPPPLAALNSPPSSRSLRSVLMRKLTMGSMVMSSTMLVSPWIRSRLSIGSPVKAPVIVM